ncbi:recombinase family protein [Lysinibacillus pakistanensis]|uniref:recombinase family protein n=1 Tax=Lysinibacillus pakistanensis TaxID=759811 RepID=UPI003D2C85B9
MIEVKRAALYVRYSTHNQDDNYSVAIQLERTKLLCASKGWVVKDDFIDPAYSGSNMERPALQEMLTRLDEFDVVVVYRLDRLSRSQRDTMTLIQDYFLKNNVDFVSVSETLDTTTAFGMAMIGILAVFAELERATITERLQGGIDKRIEAGYRLISGNYMPTGYKKGKDNEGRNILIVDEYQSKKVQRIFDLYEQYHSITKIQEILKEEGFSGRRFMTIRHILSNRLYIGEVQRRDKYYKGIHEPLITVEQFDRVQALLARHPKGANVGKAKESLFSSLITCGWCGENYMTYSYKVKNKVKGDYYVRSYLCRARRFPSEYEEKCTSQIIKNSTLESLFIKELDELLEERQTKTISVKRRTNFDVALKKIDEKINRLIDLYEDGELDKETLNTRLEKRKKERDELLNRKTLEAQEQALNIEINDIQNFLLTFDEMDFIEKRALVEKVLKSITIGPSEILFEWNF